MGASSSAVSAWFEQKKSVWHLLFHVGIFIWFSLSFYTYLYLLLCWCRSLSISSVCEVYPLFHISLPKGGGVRYNNLLLYLKKLRVCILNLLLFFLFFYFTSNTKSPNYFLPILCTSDARRSVRHGDSTSTVLVIWSECPRFGWLPNRSTTMSFVNM